MLGWVYATSSRRNQLLELQRHALIEVVGKGSHKRIHILKVYDQPATTEIFYRPNNEVYSCHEQVLVPKHLLDEGNMIVYKIQYGNEVYIGSTKRPRFRISEHFNGHANDMTYDILCKGATFELLEVVNGTEEQLRQREREYIEEYSSSGLYVVINERHNNTDKE